ncbi:MAG: hypothetical protein JW885_03525 [Deltaproteobacteria bacterium]|nr:hypothetical protein [Candidatus Zymogenaceae bacterium]
MEQDTLDKIVTVLTSKTMKKAQEAGDASTTILNDSLETLKKITAILSFVKEDDYAPFDVGVQYIDVVTDGILVLGKLWKHMGATCSCGVTLELSDDVEGIGRIYKGGRENENVEKKRCSCGRIWERVEHDVEEKGKTRRLFYWIPASNDEDLDG